MRKILISCVTILLLGCACEPESEWVCSCDQMDSVRYELNRLSMQMNHTPLSDEVQRDSILGMYRCEVETACTYKPVVSLDSCEQVMDNMNP